MDANAKKALQELLADGKVRQVLDQLLKDSTSPYYPQAIALSARYRELKDSVHKQLISRQDEALESARMVNDLVHLVSSEPLKKTSQEAKNTPVDTSAKTQVKGDNNIVIQDVDSSGITINITKKVIAPTLIPMRRTNLIFLLYTLVLLITSMAVLSGQVPLEFRQPDNTLLPEGTHILALFQESRAPNAINAGNLPSPREYKERVWDFVNPEGLTRRRYTSSLSSGKSIFVYALTPSDQLFMSSDHQGSPQFKKVVKGLIWVERIKEESDATRLARRLLTSEVRLKLETTTGASLPQGSKLLVTRAEGQYSYRIEPEELPSPETGTWLEDQLRTDQASSNRYAKSTSIDELYFVYLLTPAGDVYFSSSSDGKPVFDQVVSGRILLSPLDKSHPLYESISGKPKPQTPPEPEQAPESALQVEPVQEESQDPPAEIIESKPHEAEVEVQDSGEVYENTSSSYLWILTLLLLLAGGALSFLKKPEKEQWVLIGLGLFTAFFMGLLIHSSPLESYRIPILFAGTAFAYGLFQVWRNPGLNPISTLQTLYTPAAAGLGFSFFSYELVEGKILMGSQLHSFQDFNLGLAVLISIAAGAFVYIFSLGYLFLGKDSTIVKTLTWISLPVFALAFSINPFWGLGVAVIYLFVAAALFIGSISFQSQTLDTAASSGGISVAGIFGLFFNFFIFPALLSVGLYALIEHLMGKRKVLRFSVLRQARLLGIGSLVFHLLFLFSAALLQIDPDMLDNLAIKEVLLNSLFFGSFGLFTFAWIGFSSPSTVEANE